MSIIVLFIGVFVLGAVVVSIAGLVALFSSRGRRAAEPAPAAAPSLTQAVRQEDRQAILKKLSDGELTKDEAEEQLTRLGTPVPQAIPAPPATAGSGMSKGCLVTLLLGLILGPLLLLALMALLYFGVRVVSHDTHVPYTEVSTPVPQETNE